MYWSSCNPQVAIRAYSKTLYTVGLYSKWLVIPSMRTQKIVCWIRNRISSKVPGSHASQVRAVFPAFDMTAQRRRSAAFDRRHDLELAEAHMAGMGGTPSRPAMAEDVRHLDRRP